MSKRKRDEEAELSKRKRNDDPTDIAPEDPASSELPEDLEAEGQRAREIRRKKQHVFESDAVAAKVEEMLKDDDFDGEKHLEEEYTDQRDKSKFSDARYAAFEEDGNDDFEVTPFNMKDELKRGYIDPKTGSYRLKGEASAAADGDDDDDVKDAWIEQIDGEESIFIPQKPSSVRDNFNEPDELSAADLKTLRTTLFDNLLPGENVLRALKRLRPPVKKTGPPRGGRTGARGTKAAAKAAEDTPPVNADNTRLFELLTDAADQLVTAGHPNAYHYTKEQFEQLITGKSRGSSSSSQAADLAAAEAQWEYRINDQAEVFGPFASSQLRAWRDEGYFSSDAAVWVRQVKAADGGPANKQFSEFQLASDEALAAELFK